MSKRSAEFIRELMASLTNHWTFLPVVFVFAGIRELSPVGLITWCLIGFLPALLYLIREVVQSTLLQLCFFPILFGILVLLPLEPDIVKGCFYFFAFIYIMLSLLMTMKKNSHTKILPPFFAMGINLFTALFIFPHLEIYYYPFVLFLGMIITFITFFLAFYVDQYLIFITRNEETSNSLPKDKIFRSGMELSFYYLGIGAVILFLISSFALSDEFLGRFWGNVKNAFRKVIKYLLSLIKQKDRNTHVSDGAESFQTNFPPMEQHQSLFWQIMEVLLFALVVIILVAVLLYLLYKIFRFLKRFLPEKRIYEAEEEVENLDMHETIVPKRKTLWDAEEEGNRSIRQKIRRIYKQKARFTGWKTEDLAQSTAREVALELQNPVLSVIYEKARYTEEPCDKEDLKRLQDSFKARKKES